MLITFLGAAHEVTGSCYYLEACRKRFLVDCGMEQGPNIFENKPLPIPASELDFVLLTHAHIDHSGNLPALYAKGFRGPVYATAATRNLCDIMLRDSVHIQMSEAEWRNRKNKRQGKEEYIPPYTLQDAIGLIENIRGFPYNRVIDVEEGIKIRFTDAGHLLGSASIELWLTEDTVTKKIVFSGDIGNLNQPLLKDPVYVKQADYVVMESTYGNRSHQRVTDYVTALAGVFQETFAKGGNVVIPSFAVGRTQEMLFFIRQMKEQRLVTVFPDFEVYVDSPLAVEATHIFHESDISCFDEETSELIRKGINPISFPGLRLAITAGESKNINFDSKPKVIISASGMCDAGRVKHHLKHNLWRKESTILFVGYQSVGTPGRALTEGAKSIRLFGEPVQVNAKIQVLPGTSGHADQEGLMRWASSFENRPDHVFVTHGEDQVTEFFRERLSRELQYDAMAPYSGTIYDLRENKIVETPVPVRLERSKKSAKKNSVYERLKVAGERLLGVIRRNEGGANKDLSKFADQINSLCDKWDR